MDIADRALEEIAGLILSRSKLVQEGEVLRISELEPTFQKWQNFLGDVLERLSREFDVFYSVTEYPAETYPTYDENTKCYVMSIDQSKLGEALDWVDQRKDKAKESYTVGDISLNLNKGDMSIGENIYQVSPNHRVIKFLVILMANPGVIQSYFKIAKFVGIDVYEYENEDGSNDASLSAQVRYLKRDLARYLIDAGVSKKMAYELTAKIKAKSGVGYKLLV